MSGCRRIAVKGDGHAKGGVVRIGDVHDGIPIECSALGWVHDIHFGATAVDIDHLGFGAEQRRLCAGTVDKSAALDDVEPLGNVVGSDGNGEMLLRHAHNLHLLVQPADNAAAGVIVVRGEISPLAPFEHAGAHGAATRRREGELHRQVGVGNARDLFDVGTAILTARNFPVHGRSRRCAALEELDGEVLGNERRETDPALAAVAGHLDGGLAAGFDADVADTVAPVFDEVTGIVVEDHVLGEGGIEILLEVPAGVVHCRNEQALV